MMPFGESYANAYDVLYKDKDYEKECDFIEELFKIYSFKPSKILDLGCGTGGHAIILGKRGYKVTGIDRSIHMLKKAREKARNIELRIDFIEGDITNITLDRKFDAVISMFAVMSYQTTNSAIASVCKLAKKSLVAGGMFLFDCWYGPAVLSDKPIPCIKEINLKKDEKIIRFTNPQIDIFNHIVKVNFKMWEIKGNKVKETLESHPMRFLFPQEIRYFLEVAGFKNVDFYPFLNLNRPVEEKDWNIMVAGRI